MINIIVDTSEITDAIRRVGRFIMALQHREDLNQMLKDEQNKRWALNFSTRGGEYESWIPTSIAQQQNRVRQGSSPTPTLEATGNMLQHFLAQNDEASVANSAVTWNFFNRVQTKGGAYTVSHHTGYTLGNSRVPARLLWDLDEEDEDRGQQDTELWVEANAEKYL